MRFKVYQLNHMCWHFCKYWFQSREKENCSLFPMYLMLFFSQNYLVMKKMLPIYISCYCFSVLSNKIYPYIYTMHFKNSFCPKIIEITRYFSLSEFVCMCFSLYLVSWFVSWNIYIYIVCYYLSIFNGSYLDNLIRNDIYGWHHVSY